MTISKLGYYSALISAIGAVGYSIIQILQVIGLMGNPYDEILIYGFSLCIAPPFLIAMLALHYSVPSEKKFWSHAALLFAVMYNTFVILTYVVQLTAVIPYGITNPVLKMSPHSFFWTLDALGYITMGIATMLAVPVFNKIGPQKYARKFFLANGLMTPVITLVYFYPTFSIPLLLMGSPWCITACGSIICLAILFKKTHSGKQPFTE